MAQKRRGECDGGSGVLVWFDMIWFRFRSGVGRGAGMEDLAP